MTKAMDGQVSMFDPDTWSGKTSQVLSKATADEISKLSWKNWRGLSKKESQFLDLRRASGRPLESSSATGTQSRGESWMPNTTESHRDEDGLSSLLTSADTLHLALFLETANTSEAPLELIPSKLSDILEVDADKKYHLSATACEGILHRAERRGKELPPMLKEALEQMIQRERGGAVAVGFDGYNAACTGDKSATLGVNCGLSSGRNGVLCYDARGNGNGQTVSTITGDHENRITDYTSVVVEPAVALEGNGQRPSHRGDGYVVSDKSYTLNTTEVHGVVYAMDRASFNQGQNAQYDFEITDSGVNSTLVAKGPSAVAYGIDHVITTGGNCTAQDPCVYEDVQATLKAAGPHAVCYSIGNGQANQSYSEEVAGALNCMHDQQAVAVPANPYYIVRRLTPTECERLQGYPDGWTDIGDWVDSKGKKHKAADSPRYKALGNSIALPVWKIILKRLCACYERDATMASLFDGIGGFPYLWEQINGEGSCLWASEIEEFPMAVTRKRINKEH